MVRFSTGNPRAEAFLRNYAGTRIVEITDGQRQAVREVLDQAVRDGTGARRTALNIVGRVNQKTGRREGGLIGNTSKDISAVQRARQEILDGDPNYFQRKLRNKNFDRMVLKHAQGVERLSADQIDKIAGKYSDRLLFERGRRVARTEVRRATHQGADEAMRQLVDTGAVRPESVRKIWRATGDSRTRDSHRSLDAESIGLNAAFTSPSTGAQLRFPGDTALGALGEDVINCRCWLEHRIDFASNV